MGRFKLVCGIIAGFVLGNVFNVKAADYYDRTIINPPKAINYFAGEIRVFDDINAATDTFRVHAGGLTMTGDQIVNGNVTVSGTISGTISGTSANSLLLQGQNGAYYLSRTNHTGTQAISTLSDHNKANHDSLLINAATLSSLTTSYLLSRTNHTGTQAISTLSDHNKANHDSLLIDAASLSSHTSSYFLSRSNHTGTQTISTLSDHNKTNHDLLLIDAATLGTHTSSYYLPATGKAADSELLDGYNYDHFLGTTTAAATYITNASVASTYLPLSVASTTYFHRTGTGEFKGDGTNTDFSITSTASTFFDPLTVKTATGAGNETLIVTDMLTTNGVVGYAMKENGATKGLISYVGSGYSTANRQKDIEIVTTGLGGITLWPGGNRSIDFTYDGKMGIGTIAPAATLDVVGSAKISTTLEVAGIANFLTTVNFTDTITMKDGKTIVFGDDSDYYLGYSLTRDRLEVYRTGAIYPFAIPNANYVMINGATGGTMTHTFGVGDLYIRNGFEVDNVSYFGAGYALDDNVNMIIASGMNFYNDDGIHLFINPTDNSSNNNLILTTSANKDKDHDHETISANPTLFIQSATDPDIDNTQWVSMANNVASFDIVTGTSTKEMNIAVKGINEFQITGSSITAKVPLNVIGNFYVQGNIDVSPSSFIELATDVTIQGNFDYDQLQLALEPGTGRQLVLGEYDSRNDDFLHPTCANPTLFLQSVTRPTINSAEWTSLANNKQYFDVNTGTATKNIRFSLGGVNKFEISGSSSVFTGSLYAAGINLSDTSKINTDILFYYGTSNQFSWRMLGGSPDKLQLLNSSYDELMHWTPTTMNVKTDIFTVGSSTSTYSVELSTDAPSNTTTPSSWVLIKIGSTYHKMPVYQ